MDLTKTQKISLDEVYEYLKRFSLSDSLFIIGTVNAVLKYGVKKLFSESISPGTLKWVQDVFPQNIDRVSLMLNLTRLARFLMLSGANEYKNPILDTGSSELNHALSLVANLYDERIEPKIENKNDLDKVMGRIVQWQFPLQESKFDLTARAHLLFRKLPRDLNCTYDLDDGMQKALGLSVYEFMAIGHSLAILCSGVLKHELKIEVESLKNIVTQDKIQKFIDSSSGTPETYRRIIRGDNWKQSNTLLDIYGLDPFVQIPLIKVTHSNHLKAGSWVVPQVTYLWQRMSSGVFYLLADYEQKQAESLGISKRNPFRDSFGDIYKHYVGLQLNQPSVEEELIDLDKIEYSGLRPDFALVSEKRIILFEVKVGFLSAVSRCIGNETKIKNEIAKKDGQFAKAVKQLGEFEVALNNNLISDQRLKNKKQIIKIIIGYEDFFLANSYLLKIAEEEFGDVIKNLQIMTVSDVDTCGTILANGGKIIKPLFEKVADKNLRDWPCGQFLRDRNKGIRNKNPLLEEAFKEFIQEFSGKTSWAFEESEDNYIK